MHFSTRTLLVIVTLCALGIAVRYWVPKSQVLEIHDSYVGYYRGLGITDGSGYFGKNWYRIVVHEGNGYWEVDVNGLGYAPYRGYYETGVLREEGTCMVSENGWDIAADRHDLQHGSFYDPQGELVSRVKNGTGKQVLFYPDGTRSWELDLIDGRYSHVKMWHSNGQLVHESEYRDGRHHGQTTGYYQNGQLKYRGTYEDGKKTGVWVRYAEDGSLKSESTYSRGDK